MRPEKSTVRSRSRSPCWLSFGSSCRATSWLSTSGPGVPNRFFVHTGEPVGPMTPQIRAAHRRFKHQDPLRPAEAARTLTDFVSLRAFRRSEFCSLVHRPLGVEHMLWLYLDPGRTDARFEFDRADSDFGERDRKVLDLLLPHFRQLLRAATRRPAALGRPTELTPRELEVIVHVAAGRTNSEIGWLLGISPHTVRKHLENAYEKLGAHTRTGAVAAVFGQSPPSRGNRLRQRWLVALSARAAPIRGDTCARRGSSARSACSS
jgi:DNA-binding CsgD family transcriptional regulator